MLADLHCHTKLSDGSMGIEDIIKKKKKRGVTALSITDYDCMAGNIRAKIIGDRHGITLIHGVEISSSDSEHIDHWIYSPDKCTKVIESVFC